MPIHVCAFNLKCHCDSKDVVITGGKEKMIGMLVPQSNIIHKEQNT